MGEIIAISVIAVIIIGAAAYIIKAKLGGKKCIGCPDSSTCSGNCACCGAYTAQKNDSDNT